VLARPGAESDDLFADLSQREDVCLLRVATAAAANVAIGEIAVALGIAGPQVPPSAIDSVLAQLDAARPGTPVLAIRARQAEEPASWPSAASRCSACRCSAACSRGQWTSSSG
jgi:hypothetical protein